MEDTYSKRQKRKMGKENRNVDYLRNKRNRGKPITTWRNDFEKKIRIIWKRIARDKILYKKIGKLYVQLGGGGEKREERPIIWYDVALNPHPVKINKIKLLREIYKYILKIFTY